MDGGAQSGASAMRTSTDVPRRSLGGSQWLSAERAGNAAICLHARGLVPEPLVSFGGSVALGHQLRNPRLRAHGSPSSVLSSEPPSRLFDLPSLLPLQTRSVGLTLVYTVRDGLRKHVNGHTTELSSRRPALIEGT